MAVRRSPAATISARRGGQGSGSAKPRLALAAVTVLSLGVNTWDLDRNRLGNVFYAAADRSMAMSWHNFFFASWDPGGFISVDKPPVAVWVSALSVRLFGLNSWSVLLPSALASTAAVVILWCTVRRSFGALAATVAGVVLALTPVSIAVNRLNLPEPFLILALVGAGAAIVRSFDAVCPTRWVVLAGACIGLAFNIKMLAAFIPVPALGVALLVGTASGWRTRLGRGVVFGATAVVTSAPWLLVVDRIGAANRPWVGGSTNNTVLDLVLGYNGLGRLSGHAAIPHAPHHRPLRGALGGIIPGVPGPVRMLTPALSAQITWLLPIVVVGFAVALWVHRRNHLALAATVLWGGWLALFTVVFSGAAGIFHAYYTSVMVPGLAVGAGLAATIGWRAMQRTRGPALVGIAAVLGLTLAWQLHVANLAPTFYGWVRPCAVALVALGLVGVGAARTRASWSKLIPTALTVACLGVLVVPTAWGASEIANRALNTTVPQAGPRTGSAGRSFGAAWSDGSPPLGRFLRHHHRVETWDVAVANSMTGSGLIAYDGVSVLSLGGFSGRDPAVGVKGFARMVSAGRVRYVATPPRLSRRPRIVLMPAQVTGGRPRRILTGSNRPSVRVLEAVQGACRPVDLSRAGLAHLPGINALWDCHSRAPQIALAGHLLTAPSTDVGPRS
ncbi:MAG: ArnT family glycosyltransferase [Acidimicrobiales bacterium]